MKCLSIRQPWAWAILHGGKRIENRTWNTTYRGPILLHAGKGVGTRQEFTEAVDGLDSIMRAEDWLAFRDEHIDVTCYGEDAWWTPRDTLDRGGIVGRARLIDVITPGEHEKLSRLVSAGVEMRWWVPGQYGFVLADVEPLTFLPCKGALGLWEFDEKLLNGGAR
jgi:hypothetical protein